MFSRFFGRSTTNNRCSDREHGKGILKESSKTQSASIEDEYLSFVEASRRKTNMKAIGSMQTIFPQSALAQKILHCGHYVTCKSQNDKLIRQSIDSLKRGLSKNSKTKKITDKDIDKLVNHIEKMEEREDSYAILLDEVTTSLGDFASLDEKQQTASSDDSDNDDNDDGATAARVSIIKSAPSPQSKKNETLNVVGTKEQNSTEELDCCYDDDDEEEESDDEHTDLLAA